MSENNKYSRRQFLGQASCAAVGSTAFLSSILNLGMINTAAARPHIIGAPGDYKALVVILLAGGADSHNFLVPTDEGANNTGPYWNYANLRADLALPLRNADGSDYLININPSNTNKNFGVHPFMPKTAQLFNQGDLSYIANIGTLVEPIMTNAQVYNESKSLPLGLYSHSDQIMQWQTSVPQNRSAVGVGGRMADMLKDMNDIQEISMNISLDGKNRFQAGKTVVEYAIGNSANPNDLGIQTIPYNGNAGFLTDKRNEAVDSYVNETYSNIFQKTYGQLAQQTISSQEIFKTALAKRSGFPTTFSDENLSQDMRMMADVISVQNFLGANRQIFFTSFGGWDHHDEVINNQERMLPILDNALSEFHGSMEDLGLSDNVTVLTISDFGRTLTSNGNGSDHAWGGNSMVLGGAVNGGNVFGSYPDLLLSNVLNLDDRGRFIPTTSVDELYGDIALWFGVSPNDLDYVLPNLSNFYSHSPGTSPIGIFS